MKRRELDRIDRRILQILQEQSAGIIARQAEKTS